MSGDILRKRKIAVLGSRSVGAPYFYTSFVGHPDWHKKMMYREIITCHPVHRKSLCRIVLSYNRGHFQQDRQIQRRRIWLRHYRHSWPGETIYYPPFPTFSYVSLQDEYSILNSKHAIGIHGYVLVYSVTSRNSFDMIQIVYDKIIDFCGMNDIPCVIVGSKTDLQTRWEPRCGSVVVSVGRFQRRPYSPTRQVEPKEGEKLAKENKAAWVETSAKNAINVGQYQFTLFFSFAFNLLLLSQTRFSSYV